MGELPDVPGKDARRERSMQRLQIGTDNLRFRYVGGTPPADLAEFRKALVRQKIREGLYREAIGAIDFLGPKLFRTEIRFPSTVPVGTYRAEIYLVRDDRIVAAQSTPLFIDKHGIEQQVFDLAPDSDEEGTGFT